MGTLSTIYLNEYDLTRLGVTAELVDGLRHTPSQSWRTQPVAGRMGSLLLSGLPVVAPRSLQLRGKVVADTQAALESAVDALKSRLSQAAVELRTAAQPTRMLLVRLVSF